MIPGKMIDIHASLQSYNFNNGKDINSVKYNAINLSNNINLSTLHSVNQQQSNLQKISVDTPNTPQYGDKKVCMDISSPTLKQQYQNQQLVIQPGIQYQQQNIQPNQIMSIQNQSIHNQPIHSQNNIILTKISRPVLPSYHQKFYDSLNLDQKLQFFGGHVNQQTQNQKWNGEATILQLDIKSSSQEKLDSVKQQQIQSHMSQPQITLPAPVSQLQPTNGYQLTSDIQSVLKQNILEQPISTSDTQKLNRSQFYQDVKQSLFQKSQSYKMLETFKELYNYYQISPSYEEIQLNPVLVSDLQISNEFGQISFSQKVDISDIMPDSIKISFGDFILPPKLASKAFIVVLYGIYVRKRYQYYSI
uniref:Uncharacterized protein n=1 Tax=Spironucleus salmonicida TaxID=348837 RepID=V6LXQ9_9EUKA|eukprot:EST48501.1 Hypothetical protein SS50377_jh034 [Spironucleus salmonicida]